GWSSSRYSSALGEKGFGGFDQARGFTRLPLSERAFRGKRSVSQPPSGRATRRSPRDSRGRWMLASARQGIVSVWAAAPGAALSPTNIFAPASPPAESIHELALFILIVAAAIFLVVFTLLTYAVVRFRRRPGDPPGEPPQVYGSRQIELAWTIIP